MQVVLSDDSVLDGEVLAVLSVVPGWQFLLAEKTRHKDKESFRKLDYS